MSVVKNRALRFFLFIVGIIAVITGFIGIFLPLLPTTPFVLLAAWCFMKSSRKAHQWIYRQALLGPALVKWEKERAISRRSKILAISMILISITVMSIKIKHPYIKIPVITFLLVISVFIITRNESAKN